MRNINPNSVRKIAVAISILTLVSACGIHPVAWKPSAQPALTGATALNEKLMWAQIISLNGSFGPEDIIFDEAGNLYCGVHSGETDFSDGRILKIAPNGAVETFYEARSWVAGLHFDNNGNLVALSHREGLISISPEKKVSVLAAKDENGRPFLIPNGLDIASDGKIYFSNTSDISAYNIKYGRKVILEMKPIGGLYCYDPQSGKVRTLIAGTWFGNGVVLSKEEDYLLMTETTKYRILKYWLKGEKSGQTETFIDNLPGFPNGISVREDGTYWLGFSTKRSAALDKIHPKPGMKKLVYGMPNFLQPKAEKFGMVMNISQQGTILQSLFDPTGTTLAEAGAVKERNGYLYIGGDILPHIGKYKLEKNTSTSDHNSIN